MAKKTDKRVSLVDAQLEIDGDIAFNQEHQLFEDMDMLDWVDPLEEMRIEEERLRREDDERQHDYDRMMKDYDPYDFFWEPVSQWD